MISEKELQTLHEQIEKAFMSPELNGFEMGLLNKLEAKLRSYGVQANISDNENYRLNQIFAKVGIHRRGRRDPLTP